MTWTLTNTIADPNTGSGGIETHNAFSYLVDTYLPSKGWTTGAHPDASAFKRIGSITTANNVYGTSVTMRYWFNWQSATVPTLFYTYPDLTYTTTPGDLGTYITNPVVTYANNASYQGAGLAWKFWTSDVDANATLVTRGKKVMWYMPGLQSGIKMMYSDPAWTGADNCATTHVMPWTNYGLPIMVRYPMYANTSTTNSYVRPNYGALNIYPTVTDYSMVNNLTWYTSGNATTYNNTESLPLYSTGADIYVLKNNINNYNSTLHSGLTPADALVLSGSNYYFCTNTPANIPTAGNGAIAFDMGTSEPDLS